MPNRFLTVAITLSALSMPIAAHAADVGGVIAGAVVGAAIATAVVPLEHRAPLREYVVRENRPNYVYSDEVVVGRELRPGPYQSYPVPERYGVPDHHYAVINNRPVIFHPQTRRIIHV